MSGWWEAEDSREQDEQKAARLVNLLARYPGSREEKLRWLMQNIPHMEAELEREGIDPKDSLRFGGGMKSLTIRWWRWQQKHRPVQQQVYQHVEEEPMTEEQKAGVRAEILKFRKRQGRRGQ